MPIYTPPLLSIPRGSVRFCFPAVDIVNTGALDPNTECACGVGRASPRGMENPVPPENAWISESITSPVEALYSPVRPPPL